MIQSIRHKGLKLLFEKGRSFKIRPEHLNRLRLVLTMLNAAREVSDMNFPGSGLHALKGELDGFWSIRVSGNWRIIFKFEAGDAYDVDYTDYH
ncbi:MAG: peptidase [Candidatus Marinimicrobia bacterium CG1_02_48_14]|nr:MAG: peptidase [Candidatus Marinimicrobia bacterium CG1_02_48_14]